MGSDTIRARFADIMPAIGEPFDTLHIVTNPWITNDHARRPRKPAALPRIYEDEYRKVDDAWKFARIRLSLLSPEREFSGLLHQ